MKIEQLIKEADCKSVTGARDREVTSLTMDSRQVTAGSLFAAIEGTSCDGHRFISQAVEAGASAILCQHLPQEISDTVTYIVVENSEKELGHIASAFYGDPSLKLALVGITGTNGKTTTATLLYELFERLGYKAGLISTVVYKIDREEMPSTHTTPDSIRLNSMLARMVEQGCAYCFMEASSHSLVQHRTSGLTFAGAVFSNITHDHLDYHKTFAEYIKAKKMLFDALPKTAWALTNADDRNGAVMVQNSAAAKYTYSLRGTASFNCKIIETTLEGMLLELDRRQVWVKLLGRFNAYNVTAVYAAARLLGADTDEVLTALSSLESVSGRFQTFRSASGVTAVVDYAHTPDALENVMDTILSLGVCKKLIAVCGCGGDRDRTKRPEMALIAVTKADTAIFTSDNPRTESPEAIIDEMVAGVGGRTNYLAVTDRRQAIRAALTMASKDDVVLIAGKGHEDYQIIGNEKHHFSDQEEVLNFFNK